MEGTTSRWGRKGDSDWWTALQALGMMVFAPVLVWWFVYSCTDHDCSLIRSSQALITMYKYDGLSSLVSLLDFTHIVTREAVILWASWLLLQFLLYSYVPGPRDHGQPTPAGYTLLYVTNGWRCWWLTHILSIALLAFTGIELAPVMARRWTQLFWIANISGFALTILAYIKASVAPTHPNDNKWSGSFLYDLFMGVEHNPRLTSHPYSFDFKLFFNGRPGIIAWTLINFCFACTQFVRFGFVSNAMILVNLLQALYVLDFFWNEGWYLRTIDITHEHFGFYLAWGDQCWLPFMYTLQGLFLSTHPVELSLLGFISILLLGVGGYVLFRAVNANKDRFRKEMTRLERMSIGERKTGELKEEMQRRSIGDEPFPEFGEGVTYRGLEVRQLSHYRTWGRPTLFLPATYHTGVGNERRRSHLLLSGFWGLSRHFNYLGDLMLSAAMCLPCGFTHLLPYFYIIFMTVLLLHRVARDDEKCRQKYGKAWEIYCKLVPYKICPYIY